MSKASICVLRAGGTNCDVETKRALDDFEKIKSEVVHVNRIGGEVDLQDYDGLVIPGGFSYGDHVRAGVVLAKEITTNLTDELNDFMGEDKPILGICNGFQVLVETGLLPQFEGVNEFPTVALAINESAKYECRWVHLKNENHDNCIFTREIEEGEVLFIPLAHKEGRFLFQKEDEEKNLEKLYRNDQLVFRYCDKDGKYAEGRYPENPNGSFHDIAGICDPSGKVFGLMPHPERAFLGVQQPNWTKLREIPKYADGRLILKSMAEYLRNHFL